EAYPGKADAEIRAPAGAAEGRGARLVGEQFGADRRVVGRPHVGDTSAGAVLVDVYQVADVRELSRGALVRAGAALSVRLDQLHVVGLHGRKHKAGAGGRPVGGSGRRGS